MSQPPRLFLQASCGATVIERADDDGERGRAESPFLEGRSIRVREKGAVLIGEREVLEELDGVGGARFAEVEGGVVGDEAADAREEGGVVAEGDAALRGVGAVLHHLHGEAQTPPARSPPHPRTLRQLPPLLRPAPLSASVPAGRRPSAPPP